MAVHTNTMETPREVMGHEEKLTSTLLSASLYSDAFCFLFSSSYVSVASLALISVVEAILILFFFCVCVF